MLSWDIAASGERWTAINTRLKEVLSNYSWVRPLKTVYIVKVASQEQRQELKAAIVAIVKSTTERVNFVMSPAMEGGNYAGWLPKPLWEKIAKRTK